MLPWCSWKACDCAYGTVAGLCSALGLGDFRGDGGGVSHGVWRRRCVPVSGVDSLVRQCKLARGLQDGGGTLVRRLRRLAMCVLWSRRPLGRWRRAGRGHRWWLKMDNSASGLCSFDGHNMRRVGALCLSCRRAANADGVGLAVLSSAGMPEPTYVSDARSQLIEDLQFTLGEGPCVDAVRFGSPVLLDDVRTVSDANDRWPGFVKEIEASGVRALFAFPVRVGAIALGTLDLYRDEPGTLSAGELAAALRTVDQIASVLLDIGAAGGDGVAEHSYRMVVHQAAGMVMVQAGIGITTALSRLRATAFSEGIAINDLAADVVAGRRRLSEEER